MVRKVRENLLTDSNIRELVRLVNEEMDGFVREQRRRLETIEAEFVGVKRRLEQLHDVAETADPDILSPKAKPLLQAARRHRAKTRPIIDFDHWLLSPPPRTRPSDLPFLALCLE